MKVVAAATRLNGQSSASAGAAKAAAQVVTVRSKYFYGNAVVSCNAGETAVGGGVSTDIMSLMYVSRSEPSPNSGTPTGWNGFVSYRSDGSGASGTVYAVCATAPATQTQTPDPTPTPTPQPAVVVPPPAPVASQPAVVSPTVASAPAPADRVEIRRELVYFPTDALQVRHQWRFFRRYSRVQKLTIVGTPPGGSIVIRCSGRGCPFGRRTLAFAQGARTMSLTRLFAGRRLRPRTVIELRMLAPAHVDKIRALPRASQPDPVGQRQLRTGRPAARGLLRSRSRSLAPTPAQRSPGTTSGRASSSFAGEPRPAGEEQDRPRR